MSRTTLFVLTAAALAVAALALTPRARPHRLGGEPEVVKVEPAGAPAATVAPMKAADGETAARADGPVSVELRLSHPALAEGLHDVYAQVDLTARTLESGKRQAANLAVVIDRSGSMHGEKLRRALAAAHHLIERLDPSDRLAIVHYGGDVAALPSLLATSGNKERMHAFVTGIRDDGDTNISDALERAARELDEHRSGFAVSRIILVSDGQPTSGITSASGLTGIVERLRAQGYTVSALGVGGDFNESLMSALANQGGGFYGYISDGAMLAEIFGRELNQATSTVARQVELTLEVPEGVTVLDVFGHQISPGERSVRLPLYDLASGQAARVLARLSVRAPSGRGHLPLVQAKLRYHEVATEQVRTGLLARGAELVASEELAQARLDKAVTAAGVRALGAMMVTRAAQAYQAGNEQEAAGLFVNVRQLFGSSASALGGDPTLLAEHQSAQALEGRLKSARGSAAQLSHEVKSVQRKGLRNFGNSNTY